MKKNFEELKNLFQSKLNFCSPNNPAFFHFSPYLFSCWEKDFRNFHPYWLRRYNFKILLFFEMKTTKNKTNENLFKNYSIDNLFVYLQSWYVPAVDLSTHFGIYSPDLEFHFGYCYLNFLVQSPKNKINKNTFQNKLYKQKQIELHIYSS